MAVTQQQYVHVKSVLSGEGASYQVQEAVNISYWHQDNPIAAYALQSGQGLPHIDINALVGNPYLLWAIGDPPSSGGGGGGYSHMAEFGSATLGFGIAMTQGNVFGVLAGGLGMIGTYGGAAGEVSGAFGALGAAIGNAFGGGYGQGVEGSIGVATGIGGDSGW